MASKYYNNVYYKKFEAPNKVYCFNFSINLNVLIFYKPNACR